MQSFYNSTRSASNSSLVVASGMFSSGRVSFKEKYSVFFFSSTHYTPTSVCRFSIHLLR